MSGLLRLPGAAMEGVGVRTWGASQPNMRSWLATHGPPMSRLPLDRNLAGIVDLGYS